MVFFNPTLNSSYQSRVIPSKPEAKPTNFGGCTRLIMNTSKHPRPFLSAEEFLKVTSPFKSKVAGCLPKDFLGLFPKETKKVFQFFDEFSELARSINFEKDKSFHKLSLELSSNKKIEMTYLGEGSYGKAFKLDLGDNKIYLLKTFTGNYQNNLAIHGSIAEARTGLNLRDTDYSDLTKLHIADFNDNKMWQISEYLDKEKDFATERPGKKLEHNRPELSLGDEHDGNRINGIRFDLGGITKKQFSLEKVGKSERLSEFYKILNHPDPKVKKGIATQINYLEKPYRKQAFYDVLNHSDSEAKKDIASQIVYLDRDDRKQAFYDVLNHSDSKAKIGIATQIGTLNPKDTKQAFYDILNHPDSKIKKGLASQLGFLDEKDATTAFYEVLNHPDPEAKKDIASQIECLAQEDKKHALYAVLNHHEPETKIGIAAQIHYLNKDDIKQAFYDVLNNVDSEAKNGIATQLQYLDKNDRMQAFYDILNNTDVTARNGLVLQILKLNESDQPKAYQDVIDKTNSTIQTFKIIVKN